MPNDGNVTNSLVKIEVPESIDEAVKNLTGKPTETIGQVLSDCLFLVFGGISQKAELKRAKYAFALKEFSKELEKKVESIPEERRLEPNTHTVCTALESMKYCVEEVELRNMFSTLIANSMDKDVFEIVHPSYGDIIRQLTSYDAKLILWMKNHEAIPAVRFRVNIKGKNKYLQLPTIYIEYGMDTIEMLQVSLENMSRLKIIDLNLDTSYSDKQLYENIKKMKKYNEDKANVESQIEEDKQLDEVLGSIEISQFGRKFIDACCSNNLTNG